MNDETEKLLGHMAQMAGTNAETMLEIVVQEAALRRGILEEQAQPYTREKFPFQYRDISPHLAERIWKVRVASQNRRARNLGICGNLTYEGWIAVLEAHEGACARCGSHEYLCIDHVIPLSLGGPNLDSNTQPLCRDCNSQKAVAERVAPYFPKRQSKT